ncbi:hypothetical protein [Candidatus Carsonella ruddii]|uniref:homoserine dehydrogenase n=1 Tax=Candidatus Carsonella ruddii (Diaphorina cf. continua) TaxID=2661587 RepID=A0A7R6W0H3_CARRU|nr:hypothetical protein [Candidatus Carsonella ruddii (Diaphorina cf. continua)]BCG49360.1 homoserine dehydrogenase [Candidatus Carsonella ruddii (Diaphorina cf. continua)]
MNYSIFGLGNVGSNVYTILIKKKISTFSKNNRFNCLLLKNQVNYEKLFKKNNLFIELIGSINVSIEIVLNCIKYKNNYISANKDLVSKYLFYINFLFKKNNKKIYYEAAVCGALPIINLLNNFYSKEKIFYFLGILNGTCNYILSNIKIHKFNKLINLSIKKGMAEKQFEKDIFGLDSMYKLSILISKFNKEFFLYNYIFLESIFFINKFLKKIYYEKKHTSVYINLNNYIFLNVSLFLTNNLFLIKTNNSFNSIILNSINSKKTQIISIGAGGRETASSVISNFFQSFEKKIFLEKKCIFKKNIMLNNYFCFNYIIKLFFDYNIFYYLNFFKIKFIKFFYKQYLLIKTKKIFYKKILFFLYFFKKKNFFCYKII